MMKMKPFVDIDVDIDLMARLLFTMIITQG